MKYALSRYSFVAVVLLLALPFFVNSFTVGLFNDIGISALVVLGIVMLTGIGGVTSFGQAAFVGIAAYSSAWLTANFQVSPWLGLVLAIAVTVVAAFIIGTMTLRLGGHFMPISTIAWGLSVPLLLSNIEAFGRHTGMSNIVPVTFFDVSLGTPFAMYFLIWGSVALACVFCRNVLQSREGRALRSLRGGGQLLSSVGADPYAIKLKLFIFSAVLAAIAGWLYAHNNRYISPSPFDVRASIEFLLMAVMGGIGHLAGAIIGAILVVVLKNSLQDVLPYLTDRGAQMETIVFSLLFLFLLHFARAGLCGFIVRKFRIKSVQTVRERSEDAAPLAARSQPPRGKTILSVTNAVKRFGGLTAVGDVSFDVNAGEIVGLIGPNGAGKSTMFNLVTGTLNLTGGTIRFLDTDITKMSQRAVARLGMARTFQHVKLRPHMSLLDNVALGAHGRTRAGMWAAGLSINGSEEASTFAEARRQIARIGLQGKESELAGSLPLGTQRMVEIARALVADPLLLVLDEPAAGLRRAEKIELSDLLAELRKQGVTILIVEHDMDFVMNLVDRLIVMNFGKKLMEGEPAAVRKDKQVQAAYLGEAA